MGSEQSTQIVLYFYEEIYPQYITNSFIVKIKEKHSKECLTSD